VCCAFGTGRASVLGVDIGLGFTLVDIAAGFWMQADLSGLGGTGLAMPREGAIYINNLVLCVRYRRTSGADPAIPLMFAQV